MSKRRLCDLCQGILSLSLREETTNEHHDSIESLMRSVEQGCFVCITLERLSTSGIFHHSEYQWERPESGAQVSMQRSSNLTIIVGYGSDGEFYRGCDFQVLDPTTEGQSLSMMRLNLQPSMRAKETFTLAKDWIGECSEQHVECRTTTIHRVLPTRLVYINSTPETQNYKASICRSDTLPIETQYLTLSHCWGEREFLISTRANISSFEVSLPIRSLSKTFQDAIFATTNLGLQYIWIDSLCIVQDDEDDWKRESATMHNVYKNAVCNILASGSAGGEGGFIHDHRKFDPTPLPLGSGNECLCVDLHQSGQDYNAPCYLVPERPWFNLDNGPVYRRGWVLQEQLLAPRALHFGEDQVFWECKRTLANEVWPYGWLNTCFESDFRQATNMSVRHFRISPEQGNHDSLYRTWGLIVGDFTKRHLTFASDYLPALAGIANEFAAHLEDEYVYGIWSKDLHCGILFHQSDERTPAKEPTWQESPSWSWVALHEPVCIWSNLWDRKYHLCDITLDHNDKMPQLYLRGHPMLFPGEYKSLAIFGVNERHYTEGPDPSGFHISVLPDCWFVSNFMGDSSKQNGYESIFHGLSTSEAYDFLDADRFLESIVLMPILCLKRNPVADRFNLTIMCLLLSAHPGAQNEVYRRVGIIGAWKETTEEMDLNAIKSQLWGHQKPLSSNLFRERHEDGTYTITIV